MGMSQPYDREELIRTFLTSIQNQIEYWERYPGVSLRRRLDGVAFSILAAIDGEQATLPHFQLIPAVHDNDDPRSGNIAGELHEIFARDYFNGLLTASEKMDLRSARAESSLKAICL